MTARRRAITIGSLALTLVLFVVLGLANGNSATADFDLNAISAGGAHTWTGAEDPGYLAWHLLLDAALILAYTVLFVSLAGYVRGAARRLGAALLALTALTAGLDVAEDVLLALHQSSPALSIAKLVVFVITFCSTAISAIVVARRSSLG